MKNVYERVGCQVGNQLVFRMSEKVSTPARIKAWDKVGDILCGQMRDKFYIQVTENVYYG
jgi:hypothetical protein